ncbi:glycosyltransferase [Polaromonas sp. YR568]|uniref:glycosyltransferase n=1 Tax=Polaromonas sp. YR568 TaxID=1855301 RepID=UPI00398BD842
MTDLNTDDSQITEKLSSVYQSIQRGETPDQSDLVSLLSLETTTHRFRVNQELAKAYFYFPRDIDKAAVFAERALALCGLSEDFLAFYVELHKATGNLEAQRTAYKIVGKRYAAAGDVYTALKCFNQHRNVYALAGLGNRYDYDFDVLECIDQLALTETKNMALQSTAPSKGKKTRLAYLVFHVHHPESVIVKMLSAFAKYHNSSEFEVAFFIAESSRKNDAVSLKNIDVLTQAGGRVIQADQEDVMACLRQTAAHVRAFGPHVFITTAILAEYEHYFLSFTCPAVARIGLTYGPPELYIAPRLDWVIASLDSLIIDSPSSGSVVHIEYDLPDSQSLTISDRASLNIADDAVVLISAGRPLKFMSREFWSAILQTLEAHPRAVFVAVGLDVDPPFLAELLLDTPLADRVIRLGWQADYLGILGMADVVVDTYPSGGGLVLLDAMALSIPAVSFHHDYSQRFDQMNWNLGEDLVPLPELLVSRDNLEGLKQLLSSLIENPLQRKELGSLCRTAIHEKRSSPTRYVQSHEAIYKKILARKANGTLSLPAAPKTGFFEVLGRVFRS